MWIEGRKVRIAESPNHQITESPIAWFHCASLGEFEQGRPVIEKFKETFPDYKILLTFFSPSGYEVRKNYAGADYICYLPSDTPTNAQEFIEHFAATREWEWRQFSKVVTDWELKRYLEII